MIQNQKRPDIAFLVNGDPSSAMGVRARSFAERLTARFAVHIAYRSANRIGAVGHFLLELRRIRPEVCYVFDLAISGVLAGLAYRAISTCRMIVDTGDAIYELARVTGGRNRPALWLTKGLEHVGLYGSDRVVVRSHPHQELLAPTGIRAEVIPDGVDIAQFRPQEVPELRRELGLESYRTIGLLGSLMWNPISQACYGWELVELIHRLRDLPVRGVLIGDGSGLPHLRERCAAYGIEDRVLFLGRVAYEKLPRLINTMDICLSTQTNDTPGQVRTTGKLPLYLACGRFVIATQVGEAARVLPPEMLLPYYGSDDRTYPERLDERVRWLLERPELLRNNQSAELARRHFDYDALSVRLGETIAGLLPPQFCEPELTPARGGVSQPAASRLAAAKSTKD